MTDSMKFEVEQGHAVHSGFANSAGTAPLPPPRSLRKNVANTDVGIFDDHLLVCCEGGLPYSKHPETLETYGSYDFHDGVDVLCTGRYKTDPDSGDMLFFAATGRRLLRRLER
ncbi:carotenoid oxygenase family protein [Streptomyces liliifuscus]|uniref:Dioxygenase n=1 Tax=Streptomyces liliifuscus TaxID=2797636 RepID=A0A7T7KTP3_9ACTN|nr:carotenoid oxygenase family protein [Streptomyces liliifuscus]QQM38372.1 carotenoid oxygenase family protein [Streptomyces liliifuscus]